jgi:hypothetical protein
MLALGCRLSREPKPVLFVDDAELASRLRSF